MTEKNGDYYLTNFFQSTFQKIIHLDGPHSLFYPAHARRYLITYTVNYSVFYLKLQGNSIV